MIDHIGLKVADLEKSRDFYASALAPLGYTLLMEHEISGVGFGRDGKPNFWLKAGTPSGPIHLAFGCDKNSVVDAFHKAAILAGSKDNGSPGPRAEYHPTYYGAFVLDPDGNNVEVVCHFEQ
jgi:catechol 2,3-dioxygenase-like lactoylglutathione lyase family enzyme